MEHFEEVSNAYNFIIRYLITNMKIGYIKDLNEFISDTWQSLHHNSKKQTEKSLKKYSSKLDKDNKDKLDIFISLINERDEKALNQVNTIVDFISESDKNKSFLSMYIEYFTSYLHYYEEEKIVLGNEVECIEIANKHPYLSSPVLLDMLTNPIFFKSNGFYGAGHHYLVDNPDNPEKYTSLFDVALNQSTTLIKNGTEISVDNLLQLHCSDIVKVELEDAIKESVRNIASELPHSAFETSKYYVLNSILNMDVTLTLHLPKQYFTLKK